MRISTKQMHDVSIFSMLDRQVGLGRTQMQLSTGRRVLSPADDPVASKQILSLQKTIEITEQYQANANHTKGRLSAQEGILESSGNVIQRTRELVLRANNSYLGADDRRALASEIEQRLEEIMGHANTKDANGEYVFGGNKASTPPVAYDPVTQTYSYNGDNGQRDMQIGPSYFVASGDNAEDVYMRIREGNGTFVTDYADTNTGTGFIDDGDVTDASLVQHVDYQIDFVAPALPGDPVRYTITDVTNGNVIVGDANNNAPYNVPQDYVEGAPIQIIDGGTVVPAVAVSGRGIEVTISGEPDVGDSFTIEPARSQDVFTTMRNLVTALEKTTDSHASQIQLRIDMKEALRELDNGLNNILNIRAEVGARLNSIDGQEYVNEGYILAMQQTRSQLEDLDYTEAAGRLNRELVGLQAAQQVYEKVQNLNLFNFLR